ncbi:XRE family transcriptional regulator [Pseudoflavonifractor sp. 60]|uniref:helix-turn-helix domain-containing protein n=1 Tax=Pseudoflavonifractor sp. 60 TaxID=2304576 RepID=UPI00136F1442|nr:helix-turn-helix transcriptional regulator [Pseudoflavonifractor sp. 60]NBI68322.1 XRE family transcriptional regulator [Pseudoflavonifractor sp. 60]
MKEKSTGDLSQELMNQPNLDQYITENEAYFADVDVSTFLTNLYEKCGLSKAELARRAEMSEVYLHQVFSGRRRPSRDRLLCLCVSMEVSLEDTQRLLKQVGYAPIYLKLKRDAIIGHGILHRTPLTEVNDKLFSENEKTLF